MPVLTANEFLFYFRMAGGDSVDSAKLSGMAKIFNGQTTAGRANVSEVSEIFGLKVV